MPRRSAENADGRLPRVHLDALSARREAAVAIVVVNVGQKGESGSAAHLRRRFCTVILE